MRFEVLDKDRGFCYRVMTTRSLAMSTDMGSWHRWYTSGGDYSDEPTSTKSI